jgi:predicted DNA-binding transcriptional regulator YafY
MLHEICDAIHQRRLLRFSYGGGTRIVEPYAYGASETHELLRAYQASGFSPSRERGWKLFRVEEITEVALLDEHFAEPRQGYMRNDPCMEVVYCEI